MGALCQVAGMTRQNYYKGRQARQRLSVDERLVLALVRRERARQPRLGARKLLHVLAGEMRVAGVGMGRDRFLELLRRAELLVKRRRRSVRTTNSRHWQRVYPNLARDLVVSGPHQLLLSDITYIRTDQGFMYLSLVLDGYSRSIVGYDCSDSLEMEGALRALEEALGQLPAGQRVVHHSDRGCQYCCGAYIQRLEAQGAGISMTEQNHCYENARAERLNGILKEEYGLGGTFASKREVLEAVREAVVLYNGHRPHLSLGMRTPLEVHQAKAA